MSDYRNIMRCMRDLFPSFSKRQRQIVLYMCFDFTDKEIRKYLKISSKNLSEQKRRIREKVNKYYQV